MADMDITLFFNELRVRALADTLGKVTAETVEDKLTEAFDGLGKRADRGQEHGTANPNRRD